MMLLLDSVILIDHLNDLSESTQWLKQNHKECAISIVTRIEVLSGYSAHLARPVINLLKTFPTLELTTEAANFIGELRNQHRWKLPDAVQAGLAKHYGAKLVTRNTKDFKANKHPFVLVPY